MRHQHSCQLEAISLLQDLLLRISVKPGQTDIIVWYVYSGFQLSPYHISIKFLVLEDFIICFELLVFSLCMIILKTDELGIQTLN